MTRRMLGLISTGAGTVLILVGLLMLVGSGGTAETTTTSTTTTTVSSTTTVVTSTTTTAIPTTTTPAAVTTTVPPETVEGFVTRYRQALDEDDVEFLYGRLHPRVIEAYGEDLCRHWIGQEIVGISNYELAGEPTGPADQQFTDPEGKSFAIADTFTAPVTFTFEGTNFESEAQFALIDAVMYWLGTCR